MRGASVFARNWLRLQWRKQVVFPVVRRLYQDLYPQAERSFMLAGTARSGTTWLAEIIGSQLHCRILFEPFHPGRVAEYSDHNYFQYVRPEASHPRLRAYCEKVFTGRMRHPWIDREVSYLRPRYRVIKEIRANLFLKWAKNQFPAIPFLFVIRHPCAVVLSRMQLGWATDEDLKPFLAQPELLEDYLADKLDIIRHARSDEAKHALIWCISNLVPLAQFQPGELNITHYEHLCAAPELEIPRVFQTIGHNLNSAVLAHANTPSRTATAYSAVMRAQDKLMRWQRELTARQVGTILSVVRDFGLDNLYGEDPMPLCPIPGRRANRLSS